MSQAAFRQSYRAEARPTGTAAECPRAVQRGGGLAVESPVLRRLRYDPPGPKGFWETAFDVQKIDIIVLAALLSTD